VIRLRRTVEIHVWLEELRLTGGAHRDSTAGCCVMEAVSYVAGEHWSDRPMCASEVIAAFLRRWNDLTDDEQRQDLKSYVTRLVGSRAAPEIELHRRWMAARWLVSKETPLWLRVAHLEKDAVALETLPGGVSLDSTLQSWLHVLPRVREASNKKRQEATQRLRSVTEAAGAEGAAGAAEAAAATAAGEAAWAGWATGAAEASEATGTPGITWAAEAAEVAWATWAAWAAQATGEMWDGVLASVAEHAAFAAREAGKSERETYRVTYDAVFPAFLSGLRERMAPLQEALCGSAFRLLDDMLALSTTSHQRS